MSAPAPVAFGGRFLEPALVHKKRKGILVRSKSELIIADLLYSKNIEFQNERPLIVPDSSWRSPDFTIVDDTTGTTIYWEHLGMLSRLFYRRKWEAMQDWYARHGVLPETQKGGPAGMLVTTEDGADGSLSSDAIEEFVDRLFG